MHDRDSPLDDITRARMMQLCRDVVVLDSEEDEAPALSEMADEAKALLEVLR